MKKHHITAFYLETLLLILVFVSIILVLTDVFGLGHVQSVSAEELNTAVCLAQNAAEAVSASDSVEGLLALLDEGGNAEIMPDAAGVAARYDAAMEPDPAGVFRVEARWLPEDGGLVRSVIEVRRAERAEPVYTLNTAVYLREVDG